MKINNYILLISALFVLSSCNNQEDSSSSSASDATTTEATTSTEESTSSSSTGFENQSYLVETSKIDTDNWKNNFAAGFQFDNVNNVESLRTYLDAGHNLIESIECSKVQSGAFGVDGKEVALQIGSSKSDGYILFNFAKPVSAIQLSVMTYNKTYTGGSTLDSSSKVELTGSGVTKLIDLTPVDNQPQVVGDHLTFEQGTRTFKLETKGFAETSSAGRVLIQYFVFEY